MMKGRREIVERQERTGATQNGLNMSYMETEPVTKNKNTKSNTRSSDVFMATITFQGCNKESTFCS